MSRIIRAPEPSQTGTEPVVFLAGPMKGALPWQEDAAQMLTAARPDIWVASPRRLVMHERDLGDIEKAEQVDWETKHLRLAGLFGCVLFWLAAKDHDVPGREYAQTTRFELGEWKERASRGGCRMALGIEPGFSNGKYLRRRFAQDCPHIEIRDTLQDVVADAAALCPSA